MQRLIARMIHVAKRIRFPWKTRFFEWNTCKGGGES